MREQDNIRTIKKYQNRKLYDTRDSCYITLDDIASMVRRGEEIKVIDNKTKNDVTAIIFTQILVDQEKAAKSNLPVTMLRDIIRRGKGSLFDFIQRYVVLGTPSDPTRRTEAERYVDQLITRGDLTKSEGHTLLSEVLEGEGFEQEFDVEIGQRISKSLRKTEQISKLENHIKALNDKIQTLEKRVVSHR